MQEVEIVNGGDTAMDMAQGEAAVLGLTVAAPLGLALGFGLAVGFGLIYGAYYYSDYASRMA